ncbi:MAG: galactokinase family protein [Acidimicrobiales bacterium]
MGRSPGSVVVHAPGRVNLIGDHTDYTGGLVLPMAIDRGTLIEGRRGGDLVELSSAEEPDPAVLPLDVDDPKGVAPDWARYVAGVVAEVRPSVGFVGTVTTTLPGEGLSSSASLAVAVALALGAGEGPIALAQLCQRAEQRASGVPCGIMDPLASTAGVADHALLIDCYALSVAPVALPPDLEVVVVHSGEPRTLAGSAYGERRAQCEAAEQVIGPLRRADPGDESGIADPVLRRRARHVLSENARVRRFATAIEAGDLVGAGAAMAESHTSLRDDFEVSTPAIDALVARLGAVPGVYGVRLTGGGFGGCVVALTRPGSLSVGWPVRAVVGATVLSGMFGGYESGRSAH